MLFLMHVRNNILMFSRPGAVYLTIFRKIDDLDKEGLIVINCDKNNTKGVIVIDCDKNLYRAEGGIVINQAGWISSGVRCIKNQ